MSLYGKILQWQTRLVLLHPAKNDPARLELSLVVVDLVESSVGVAVNHERIVTYDALSYTWGTADPSVECVCNGTVILLRDNLASALRYLRKSHDERYVWVDFLCINQQDESEKGFQIPNMQAIYSKASKVVIWLGDSPIIDDTAQSCQDECGLVTEILVCTNHKVDLWRQIMESSWFQRTWVRQEVYAAKRLYVCTRYFTRSWEEFTAMLADLKQFHSSFNQKNLRNLRSLNESYNALRKFERLHPTVRLLGLLQQGTGFEATQPHDHVYSILGMVPLPKDGTSLVPVVYGKSYQELCGDITRLIIRETGNIDILQLCLAQRDPTYAFNWPTLNWSLYGKDDLRAEDLARSEKRSFALYRGRNYLPPTIEINNDWFIPENPIREANDFKVLANDDSSSALSNFVTPRHLVLYGKVWGTLSLMAPTRSVVTYLAVNIADVPIQIPALEAVSRRNAHFLIFKRDLIRRRVTNSPGDSSVIEFESLVRWKCFGKPNEGDIFVSLEPGPRKVLLRKTLVNTFDVVGWAESENRSERLLEGKSDWDVSTYGPPQEKRSQFNIR